MENSTLGSVEPFRRDPFNHRQPLRFVWTKPCFSSGRYGARTCDLQLVELAL